MRFVACVRTICGVMAGFAALTIAAPAFAQSSSPSIWNGIYVGGTAGYGEAEEEPLAPFDVTGGVFGIYGGYNFSFGQVVAGIEVDYTWSDLEDTIRVAPDSATIGFDNLGSVRARLGYAFDQALVYATAGYAWADFTGSVTLGGVTTSETADLDGFVLGGGFEYKFTSNISGRVEGLHYWLEPDGADEDIGFGVVRAGLAVHFNP
jgi:outer membrane immunogenic protein